MSENLDKALELWTDSETCEFIKKNNLGKSLSLYLSRILISLVECIDINEPSFRMRVTLIRLLSRTELNISSSRDAEGKLHFEANWDDSLDKTRDFHKWVDDFGDDYDKTN